MELEALKIVSGTYNTQLINEVNAKKKVDKILNDIGKTYSDIELCLNRVTDTPYRNSDEVYRTQSYTFGRECWTTTSHIQSEKLKFEKEYNTNIIPKKERHKEFLETHFRAQGKSHSSKGFLEGFRFSLLIQKVLYNIVNAEVSELLELGGEDDEEDEKILANGTKWNIREWVEIKVKYLCGDYEDYYDDPPKYIFCSKVDKNKILDMVIKSVKTGQFFGCDLDPLNNNDCNDPREIKNNESLMENEVYHHKSRSETTWLFS